jgi:hypothetical protein
MLVTRCSKKKKQKKKKAEAITGGLTLPRLASNGGQGEEVTEGGAYMTQPNGRGLVCFYYMIINKGGRFCVGIVRPSSRDWAFFSRCGIH